MYYIGIDLGTSAVKLLLMQGDGQIANIVSREYPIAFPHPGWSEQNPADWWDAVCAGIPELLNGFDASQVAGIGAGGQMHGLVVLDAQDKVIRPCILWNDGPQTAVDARYRAGELCKDQQDHAAEGLHQLQADRRTLHRLLRCFRHAAAGCAAQVLEQRNAGYLRR